MTDETESIRREMIATGQTHRDLEEAKRRPGPMDERRTWDTDQLREEFDVVGFAAPFVVVVRKSDGVKGSLEFTHTPRMYFNFVPA